MSVWKAGLTDFQGNFLGEVWNAKDAKFSFPLNDWPTVSFTIRGNNPSAADIEASAYDVYLILYQQLANGSWVLRFTGELVTAEEVGENYRRQISRETILTQAYSLPSDYPEGNEVKVGRDADAIATRGLYEEVIPSDVNGAVLRQSLVDNHVRIRKAGVEKVTFQPQLGSPVFNTGWSVGDVVTARGVVTDAETVALTFVGPGWRLSKRMIGKSQDGQTFPIQASSAIASALVTATIGAATGADSGIRIGTVTASNEVSVDTPWRYKPISEALKEMSQAQSFPVSALETFDTKTPGSLLAGQTVERPTSSTWLGYRSSNDVSVVSGGGYVVKAGNEGIDRFDVISGVSSTSVLAELNIRRSTTTGGTGGAGDPTFSQALVTRFTAGAGPAGSALLSFIRCGALISWNGSAWDYTLFVEKWKNDVRTTLYQAADAGGILTTVDAWARLQLYIDTSGNWEFVAYKLGESPEGTIATGTDADLATGGTLASGLTGFSDYGGGSAVTTRGYDSLVVRDPSQPPLSFDFEFAPSVPTVDVDGVKIATFNAIPAIGSDKSVQTGDGSAVFEYGASGPDRTVRFNAPYRIFGAEVALDEVGKETVTPDFGPE